ncbi:DUF3693 domain-containing protein [Xanthomonas citri]
MSTIDALLDAAMKAVHAKNDTELAKALGIKPAAVSNYRRGVSLPNAVVCATLAGLTGEPLAKVLGVVGEARAISSDEKAVWRRLAATAMTLALGMSLALPVRAEAAVKAFQDTPNYTLCEIGCWRSCAPWRPTNADPSTAADRTMTLVT